MKLKSFIPKIGIYKIINTKNGKQYIGQSKNIEARLHEHTKALMNGSHNNKELLDDFRQFGVNRFEAHVLELCPENELLKREIEWITKLHGEGVDLYNLNDKRAFLACNPEKRLSPSRFTKEERRAKSYSRTYFLVD